MVILKRLAKVNATGKRFFVLREEKGKVYCQGNVLTVSGCSATHGPDRIFLCNRVHIDEVEYNEELLQELLREAIS